MSERENIFTTEFRDKLEEPRTEQITVRQLRAEYALTQEMRELIKRIEGRLGDPRAVNRLNKIDDSLKWIQGQINHTIEQAEEENHGR